MFSLFAFIVLYILQVGLILSELNEDNYTSRLNVILDLIPFAWILFLIKNIILGAIDMIFDSEIWQNFKKLGTWRERT